MAQSLLDTRQIRITSFLSTGDERVLERDVLDGLTRPFKELPPKHFYDARGSELFEQICELPEYYPTRAEKEILAARAGEVAALTGAAELVELGSGASAKAHMLLGAIAAAGRAPRYIPFDVSEQAVTAAALSLVEALPQLRVRGVVGDFERHLGEIPRGGAAPRIVALLGGTIGNFPPGSRRGFLREVRRVLRPRDNLLLGADLVKDVAVLEAAYDDAQGVTAEFNRNVLHVINRELEADFIPEQFDHVAFFDRRHEWIEMRLRAQRPCLVRIPPLDLRVEFAAGEELRTEISAKFTRRRIEADLGAAGLRLRELFTDDAERFALALAGPAQ